MNSTNPKIDAYISKTNKWRDETEALRMIALDCQLTESLKWGKPCYAFDNHNIVLIQGFRDYCALLFFKGALLEDPKGVLQKVGENTQAGRQIRFTCIQDINKLKATVKAYIKAAIAVEKAGLKVAFKKQPEPVPAELQTRFEEMPALKTAFEALTPGRQRAYILHISAAKQSTTRHARIEKHLSKILAGKGMND